MRSRLVWDQRVVELGRPRTTDRRDVSGGSRGGVGPIPSLLCPFLSEERSGSGRLTRSPQKLLELKRADGMQLKSLSRIEFLAIN